MHFGGRGRLLQLLLLLLQTTLSLTLAVPLLLPLEQQQQQQQTLPLPLTSNSAQATNSNIAPANHDFARLAGGLVTTTISITSKATTTTLLHSTTTISLIPTKPTSTTLPASKTSTKAPATTTSEAAAASSSNSDLPTQTQIQDNPTVTGDASSNGPGMGSPSSSGSSAGSGSGSTSTTNGTVLTSPAGSGLHITLILSLTFMSLLAAIALVGVSYYVYKKVRRDRLIHASNNGNLSGDGAGGSGGGGSNMTILSMNDPMREAIVRRSMSMAAAARESVDGGSVVSSARGGSERDLEDEGYRGRSRTRSEVSAFSSQSGVHSRPTSIMESPRMGLPTAPAMGLYANGRGSNPALRRTLLFPGSGVGAPRQSMSDRSGGSSEGGGWRMSTDFLALANAAHISGVKGGLGVVSTTPPPGIHIIDMPNTPISLIKPKAQKIVPVPAVSAQPTVIVSGVAEPVTPSTSLSSFPTTDYHQESFPPLAVTPPSDDGNVNAAVAPSSIMEVPVDIAESYYTRVATSTL